MSALKALPVVLFRFDHRERRQVDAVIEVNRTGRGQIGREVPDWPTLPFSA